MIRVSTLSTSLRLVAAFLIPFLVFAQTRPKTQSPPSNATLAKAVDMGTREIRIFATEEKIEFALKTSWIAGEKREGMFRYKMTVSVPLVAFLQDSDVMKDANAKLLGKLRSCLLSLELHDADDFVVRRHPMKFVGVIEEEKGRLATLTANDAFQLSVEEYRAFTRDGSWNVAWQCAE